MGVARIPTCPLLHIAIHDRDTLNLMDKTAPQAWLATHLPALTQATQTFFLFLRGFREKVTVHHRVEQPLPVLLGYIRDEPRVTLAMEANFLGKAALDQKVRCVASQNRLIVRGWKNLDYSPYTQSQ